ncbi:hypothetical protein [Eggerthella lenta]|uniref:hypothetical protein n=1 Tax=Eggerthella lenta TaxID=84112 RepID=UPI001E4097F4|nr:hypothetical protein [Eggerthella lenta]
MHNVEESTLDMLEEICADDIIREERDIDLLIAPFLLHRSTLHCYSVPWQTAT